MENEMILNLEYDDGSTEECLAIAIFEVEGQDYIVLMPTDQLEDEECEVAMYRYAEGEDGEPILSDIESEEEFEMVQECYFDLLEEDDELDEE